MSSENDLVTAIKESLENDGSLRRLRAEMRTKVISILNGETHFTPPQQPKEALIINELIREYLNWCGFKYAKSVFIQESGLNFEPLTRSQILEELGLRDTDESSKLSVLHGIISTFKEQFTNESN
ncbi:UNVERIFIED_CONTAM: hypothetical protein PYX00_000878 [Menopon gallinae]|uniref:Centrosomal protein 43 n=1 Tax=Menopon gallinae TaxID=328185 RepID=A0AAW2IBX4_9NEOP